MSSNYFHGALEQACLLKKFRDARTKICYETAKRWMIPLEFKATTASKEGFTDSHERVDVMKSRVQFPEHMAEFHSHFRKIGFLYLSYCMLPFRTFCIFVISYT
jgi:hypothetical protein